MTGARGVSVAVVGLGLVGGSLARRLAAAGVDVVGWDADPGCRKAAQAAGLRAPARLDDAVAGVDVVVVAVPLPALDALLPAVAAAARPDTVVTDVTSVKLPVLAAARAAGLEGRFVGGHPMAGTERSGFAASDPALLAGATWVLCLEPDTDLAGWVAVAALLTAVDCTVLPCTAAEHDAALARVSGLPHLLAAALAVAGAGGGPLPLALAAGSFRDGSRVAASRPGLVTALCDGNRAALADVLDDAVARLAAARDALRAGGSVRPLLDAGHRARLRWEHAAAAGSVPAEVRVDDPDLRRRLLALGRQGGRVGAVDGPVLRCRTAVPGGPGAG